MASNDNLRRHILSQRDQLGTEKRQALSRQICSAFLDLPELGQVTSIFIYVNFRSEVETMPLIRRLLQGDTIVTVPWTDQAHHALEVIRISDPDTDLAPGYCNIPEPVPAQRTTMRFDPRQLDMVIVPGSVFDRHGGRMGYGGGYYDRFLACDAPQAMRVALAFDLQLVDHLCLKPHDQPMDILITESGIQRFAQETSHDHNCHLSPPTVSRP